MFAAGASATINLVLHHAVDMQVPIGCASVAVFPGDIIRGDSEGVIVIPRHLANEIAEPAYEQDRLESFLLEKIVEGRPLIGTYPPNDETLAEYRATQGSTQG